MIYHCGKQLSGFWGMGQGRKYRGDTKDKDEESLKSNVGVRVHDQTLSFKYKWYIIQQQHLHSLEEQAEKLQRPISPLNTAFFLDLAQQPGLLLSIGFPSASSTWPWYASLDGQSSFDPSWTIGKCRS